MEYGKASAPLTLLPGARPSPAPTARAALTFLWLSSQRSQQQLRLCGRGRDAPSRLPPVGVAGVVPGQAEQLREGRARLPTQLRVKTRLRQLSTAPLGISW